MNTPHDPQSAATLPTFSAPEFSTSTSPFLTASGDVTTWKRRTQDYRVSRVAILCKDCGNDCGFYPARHQCSKDLTLTSSSDSLADDEIVVSSPNTPIATTNSSFSAWTQWWQKNSSPNHKPDDGGDPTDSISGKGEDTSSLFTEWVASNKWSELWNKFKTSVQVKSKSENSDGNDNDNENGNGDLNNSEMQTRIRSNSDASSSIRSYYLTKHGPIPESLKPKSLVRPDDALLQKFEQKHRDKLLLQNQLRRQPI